MRIKFTKMQGAGNDFMVVDWPQGTALPSAEQIRRWSDRRRGVGFDQLLLLVGHPGNGVDAEYRIYNADGGEVEQCGNGARCLADYVGRAAGRSDVRLGSPAGVVDAKLRADGEVSVNLGVPNFAPTAGFLVGFEQQQRYRLTVAGTDVEFGAVSLGNPHVVIAVDSVDQAPVGILGAAFQEQPGFPRGVNVGFMEVLSDTQIRLRVFERGVGETLACGTGAAAAMIVGRSWGRLAEAVRVTLPGGTLGVQWEGPGSAVWLSGLATAVYEGQISL
jgi:diaminopimelate epimerase